MTIQISLDIKSRETHEPCELHPIQKEFVREQYSHRFNLFGGALGSSKTSTLLWIVAQEVWRHPGLRILFAHSFQDDAYGALVAPFLDIFPSYYVDPNTEETVPLKYSENQQKCFLLIGPNPREPSRIDWMGLHPSTTGVRNLWTIGYSYDLAVITQVERLEEDAFLAVRARVGRRLVPNFKPRILMDCNPTHSWPYKRFIRKQLDRGEVKEEYYFLNSKTEDNPSLSKEYRDDLKNLPDAIKRSLYLGEWDSIRGLVYPSEQVFFPLKTVVSFSDIPFQTNWSFYESVDWGYQIDPYAVLFYCSDDDGNLYFLDELEGYRSSPHEVADRIRHKRYKIFREIAAQHKFSPEEMYSRYRATFGPPDMNRVESGSARSIGDQFANDPNNRDWMGVPITTVTYQQMKKLSIDQSRIMSLVELMRPDPAHRHPINQELNAPRCYIADRCTRLLEQINQAHYEEDKPSEMGMMAKPRIRNRFADDPSDTHHWDLDDCATRAASQHRSGRNRVAQQVETIFTKHWRKRRAALSGKPYREVPYV